MGLLSCAAVGAMCASAAFAAVPARSAPGIVSSGATTTSTSMLVVRLSRGPVVVGGTAPVGLPDPRTDPATPVFPASTSLGTARRWLSEAVALRVKRLAALDQSVASSTSLSAAQRGALNALVSGAQAGLSNVSDALAGLASLAAANATAAAMVGSVRVYSLVVPEVAIVESATDVVVAAARLKALEGPFETAISALRRSNMGASIARTYSRFASEVNRSSLLGTSAAASALGVGATASPSQFAPARQALSSAQATLQSARADLRHLVALLAAPASHHGAPGRSG